MLQSAGHPANAAPLKLPATYLPSRKVMNLLFNDRHLLLHQLEAGRSTRAKNHLLRLGKEKESYVMLQRAVSSVALANCSSRSSPVNWMERAASSQDARIHK